MHPTNPALPGPAAALLRGIGTCGLSELVPQVAAAILDDTDGTTTGPALLALRDGHWIAERQP